MTLEQDYLGKVAITAEEHNSSSSYDELVLTSDSEHRNVYISRKPVPVGVELTDSRYWKLILSFDDELMQSYHAFVLESINKIDTLTRQYQNKFVTLDNLYNDAVNRYNTVVNKYNTLINKYNNLLNEYNRINAVYARLTTEANSISEQYNYVNQELNKVKQLLEYCASKFRKQEESGGGNSGTIIDPSDTCLCKIAESLAAIGDGINTLSDSIGKIAAEGITLNQGKGFQNLGDPTEEHGGGGSDIDPNNPNNVQIEILADDFDRYGNTTVGIAVSSNKNPIDSIKVYKNGGLITSVTDGIGTEDNPWYRTVAAKHRDVILVQVSQDGKTFVKELTVLDPAREGKPDDWDPDNPDSVVIGISASDWVNGRNTAKVRVTAAVDSVTSISIKSNGTEIINVGPQEVPYETTFQITDPTTVHVDVVSSGTTISAEKTFKDPNGSGAADYDPENPRNVQIEFTEGEWNNGKSNIGISVDSNDEQVDEIIIKKNGEIVYQGTNVTCPFSDSIEVSDGDTIEVSVTAGGKTVVKSQEFKDPYGSGSGRPDYDPNNPHNVQLGLTAGSWNNGKCRITATVSSADKNVDSVAITFNGETILSSDNVATQDVFTHEFFVTTGGTVVLTAIEMGKAFTRELTVHDSSYDPNNPHNVNIEITNGAFDDNNNTTVNTKVTADDGIFDTIVVSVNGEPKYTQNNIASLNYSFDASDGDVIEVTATMDGKLFEESLTLHNTGGGGSTEHVLYIGSGSSYTDAIKSANVRDWSNTNKEYLFTVEHEGDKVYVVSDTDTAAEINNITMSLFGFPFNKSVNGNYTIWTSKNKYKAGTYPIEFNK